MAETTKSVFSRNPDDESVRVPKNGGRTRVSGTLVRGKDSPDPDYHAEAQARYADGH